MQCHHGLAGTRASLYDNHALQRGADDLVLFALDSCGNVSEAPRTRRLKCVDQRSVPLNSAGLSLLVETVEVAEEFVLDTQEFSPSRCKVTPSLETERVGTRRPVERLGGGRTPIDHNRFLGAVPHPDTTNVERVTKAIGCVVDATKDQRGIADVELRQTVDNVLGEHLSLEARLIGTTGTHFKIRGELSRELARLLERSMRPVEIRLFSFEFGRNRDLRCS